YRGVVQPFTDSQIALMETFADQAAIAIENARLLTELQAKNHSLTETLEQQTATAEILRVISASPTDEQPVFDAIVQSARRLLSGHGSALTRVVGDMLHLAAFTTGRRTGNDATRAFFPMALTSDTSVHPR